MSWLSGVSSALGAPAGGATLAGAIYIASIAAEREAKSDALHDIAHAIQDANLIKGFIPPTFINDIFKYTFSKRHLELKCMIRSAYATLAFTFSFGLWFVVKTKGENNGLYDIPWLMEFLFLCLVSDYIALGKTRLTIFLMQRYYRKGVTAFIVLADVILSLLIAGGFLAIMKVKVDYETFGAEIDNISMFLQQLYKWIMLAGLRSVFTGAGDYFPAGGILICSTIMTSTWVVLTFASSILLSLALPLRAFISWFFPVDDHPVRAIGVVTGLLVWVGSLLFAIG